MIIKRKMAKTQKSILSRVLKIVIVIHYIFVIKI